MLEHQTVRELAHMIRCRPETTEEVPQTSNG